LLLAHPGLVDPNFRRTVVLLSAHSNDGAMGVIINRPLGKTLADISGEFALGDLASVPVYCGGPVSEKQLILSAWEGSADETVFKLYFGLDPEKAAELKRNNESVELRAFLGYSGWEQGQLEGELQERAWVVSNVQGDLRHAEKGVALWREIIGKVSPEMRLLAEAPDDPQVN
jgi:putative transcriptional regulator